jgi:hypothetical protein
MINLLPSSSDPSPPRATSLVEAESYYLALQSEHYHGLPAVALSKERFEALLPFLERFQRSSPSEFAALWLFDMPDGGVSFSTHLHQPRPGVAFSKFLQSQKLGDDLQPFVGHWRKLVGFYYAFRLLYVRTDPDEPIPELSQQSGGSN